MNWGYDMGHRREASLELRSKLDEVKMVNEHGRHPDVRSGRPS